jgi:HNH endonuclease
MKRSEIKRSSALPRNRKPLAPKRKTSTAAKKRKAVQLWGEYVHARDKYCQRCGKGDGKLDAHHVLIKNFAMTAADESNGVLLCFKCHGLMHSDPQEALQFYSRHFGIDGYQELRERAYSGVGKTLRAAHWDEAIERLNMKLARPDV